MRDYDVVVIGTGIGGLTAAASLAKAGRRVLVLERHNVPGGYAQTFRRGRFEFDVAVHWLTAIGTAENPGPLGQMLDGLGVSRKLTFIPVRDFIRCVMPGFDLTMPFGIEALQECLCERFPASAREIRSFIALMRGLAAEIQAVGPGRQPPEDLTSYPLMQRYRGRSLADVLGALLPDETLCLALAQVGNYFSQPAGRISFIDFLFVLSMFLTHGAVLVRGKAQALAQAFVDVIEENGGDVRLNCGAARIVAGNGGIRGVTAEDGTNIVCPRVISNADPVSTCLQLLGREHVPAPYLRQLASLSPGGGIISVYLGLDCPAEELGLRNHTTFVMGGEGPVSLDGTAEFDRLQRGESLFPPGVAVANYSASDADYAPPGTTVMSISTATYGTAWLKLDPATYAETKRRTADRLLGYAETLTPALRDHIEVMEVGTPLTNIRYTGNLGGSFVGFAETRTIDPRRLATRGPLAGLYFASGWVNGGGVPVCAMSGMMASLCVLEDEAKERHEEGRPRGPSPSTETAGEPPADALVEGPAALLRRQGEVMAALHPGLLDVEVIAVVPETESTGTLRLAPVAGRPLPPFSPGQFLTVFVNIDGVTTSRPYSISSPLGRPYYEITVRRKAGGFVSPYLLDGVQAGDRLSVTEPLGTFCFDSLHGDRPLVFLAGGSGITPFASYIRHAAEKGLPRPVHLIYGSRDPEDVIFGSEIEALAAKNPRIRVDIVISEPPAGWRGLAGFLDAAMISSRVGPVAGKDFFVAGPPEMHALIEGALRSLGVPARHVSREVFGPPVDVSKEPGWPGVSPREEFVCREERTGVSFPARAGEPLLAAMERAHVVVPVQCRVGHCSACRTKLLSGEVFVAGGVLRRWADEQGGYIHPCMTYPLGAVRIRIP